MIIRETPPAHKRLNKDIRFPNHPGDPKWIDLEEWRLLRESTAIEMQKEEPHAVRFGLDNSSWGAVNEDAADVGWGTANQGANDNGWGATNTSSDQGWGP